MPHKLVLISLLGILCLGGCRDSIPEQAPVFTSTITQLNEAGAITAANTVSINAPNWGGSQRIIWMASEGMQVAAGDTVILFETDTFGAYIKQNADELDLMRLKVSGARAQDVANRTRTRNSIAKARLANEMAGLDQENKRYESEAVRQNAELAGKQAEIDLQQANRNSLAQTTLDSLEIAQALLKAVKQEARVDRLQTYLDQLAVTTPAEGMVVYHREYTDEGIKSFRAGDEVPRQATVLEITDTSTMKVQFTVHEKDRWRLQKGQKVEVVLDAYVNTVFPGMVENVSRLPQEAEEGGVARRFEAIATIDANDSRLKPGMSARVTIELGGNSE